MFYRKTSVFVFPLCSFQRTFGLSQLFYGLDLPLKEFLCSLKIKQLVAYQRFFVSLDTLLIHPLSVRRLCYFRSSLERR